MIALKFLLPALLSVGLVRVTPEVVPDPQAIDKELVNREIWRTSVRNENEALNFLRSAFKRARTGGRVYYSADMCQGAYDDIPFPALRVNLPSTKQADLSTVQEMFADDPRVAVSRGPGGLIDIRIGEVPDEFLRTRIARIQFDPNEQYNEGLALDQIMHAKAVGKAVHRLHLGQPLRFVSILSSGPIPGEPHLPRAMKNVTLDEALDQVAQTFSGIIVFRYCADKRFYGVDFTGGYNYIDDLPEPAK
jgi:hypothetical protein